MENKYRVWCKNKNEWEKDRIFIEPNGKIYEMLSNGRLIEVREDTHIIQWFTGLKDRNGKEIYEGDIVYEKSWWWGPGYVILNIGDVGPCHSPCVMSWVTSRNVDNPKSNVSHNLWDFDEVEIIGDICTTPELLKEGGING